MDSGGLLFMKNRKKSYKKNIHAIFIMKNSHNFFFWFSAINFSLCNVNAFQFKSSKFDMPIMSFLTELFKLQLKKSFDLPLFENHDQ